MKLHTKSDFTALMHRCLDPLLPLYSEGGARLHLGDTGVTYPGRTIEMEAFSRPLWALAPFWTGGGRADDFLRIYRKGLASGTDPESPEYWGDPNDYDQLFVEMAALACAILETPESVWEPLTDAEKANLAKWLDTINHHDLSASAASFSAFTCSASCFCLAMMKSARSRCSFPVCFFELPLSISRHSAKSVCMSLMAFSSSLQDFPVSWFIQSHTIWA